MRVIRNKTFETNSSSTHAVAIVKSEDNLEKPGLLKLAYDGEYGWQIATYSDQYNKFTYLAILAMAAQEAKGTNYGTYIEKEQNVELNDRRDDELTRLFEKLEELGFFFEDEFSDHSKENIREKLKGYDYYIDHSTEGVGFFLEIIEDIDMLKRFMLSPKSFITTGNDNDDTDIFEGPNTEFKLNLKVEETEWGSIRYLTDSLENDYDIRYKGN